MYVCVSESLPTSPDILESNVTNYFIIFQKNIYNSFSLTILK